MYFIAIIWMYIKSFCEMIVYGVWKIIKCITHYLMLDHILEDMMAIIYQIYYAATRYNSHIVITSWLAILAWSIDVFGAFYILNHSIYEFRMTRAQHKLLTALLVVAIALGPTVLAILTATCCSKKRLKIAMATSVVCNFAACFARNWLSFGIFKFLSSLMAGCAFPIGHILLTENAIPHKGLFLTIISTSVFLIFHNNDIALENPPTDLYAYTTIPYLMTNMFRWRILNLLSTSVSAFVVINAQIVFENDIYLNALKERQDRGLLPRYKESWYEPCDCAECKIDPSTLKHTNPEILPDYFVNDRLKSFIMRVMPMLQPPLLNYTLIMIGLYFVFYVNLFVYVLGREIIVNAFYAPAPHGANNLTLCQMIGVYERNQIKKIVEYLTMSASVCFPLAFVNGAIPLLINCYGRKKVFIGIQLISGLAIMFVDVSTYWKYTWLIFGLYFCGLLNLGIIVSYTTSIYRSYMRTMAFCIFMNLGAHSGLLVYILLNYGLLNNCENVFYACGGISLFGALLAFLLPTDKDLMKQMSNLYNKKPFKRILIKNKWNARNTDAPETLIEIYKEDELVRSIRITILREFQQL